MLIHSSRIVTPEGIVDAIVKIEDGKIQEFINPNARIKVDLELGDLRIIPGIIDTHNHGTMGYTLMGEYGNKEELVKGYLKGLASQGVTACLPTADVDYFPAIVHVCREGFEGALPLGIHSEGPYLNRVGEKGIKEETPMIDMEYVKKMIEDAEGMLKIVDIAPEIDGAKEAIEYFLSQGIRVGFAHSDMNYQEALESFKWGISVTTHTANVMSGIHHRNMGGLGACLLSDDVYNELICDGLHVSNEMIELMLRVKNDYLNKTMIVSDNIAMAGAPVGRYSIPGMLDVNIDENGYCLTDTGRLYGSTVPVIGGIRNLVEKMHMDLCDVMKMASYNPAKVYGAEEKGSLEIGKDADFAVIDDEYRVLLTYREGRCIYDAKKDGNVFNPMFMKMLGK